MKAKTLLVILARRFGVLLAGLEAILPAQPTLGDVDSPEALAAYQAQKRATKQARREAAEDPSQAPRRGGQHL
jgi:hypothetical protein